MHSECSINVGFCYYLNVPCLKALGREESLERWRLVHSSLESYSSLEKALIFLHDSDAAFLKGWGWISSYKQGGTSRPHHA